ncbi:hypothetical protein AVEN_102911-1 [Araneus ventricosus]|uniref:Mos1 transposase HTH domain-containing protein n=1 Tax=Araneus ventricosus TaxID=182803 RepID=A0A4Y2I1C1_ARAVE|nr:hypothetical protein AVEN_102911-1 [Araneus ventricosus]
MRYTSGKAIQLTTRIHRSTKVIEVCRFVQIFTSTCLVLRANQKWVIELEHYSKEEVLGVIRFLWGQEEKTCDIHQELLEIYGKSVMSQKQVYVWCNAFASGRSAMADDDRNGRPATSMSMP